MVWENRNLDIPNFPVGHRKIGIWIYQAFWYGMEK